MLGKRVRVKINSHLKINYKAALWLKMRKILLNKAMFLRIAFMISNKTILEIYKAVSWFNNNNNNNNNKAGQILHWLRHKCLK